MYGNGGFAHQLPISAYSAFLLILKFSCWFIWWGEISRGQGGKLSLVTIATHRASFLRKSGRPNQLQDLVVISEASNYHTVKSRLVLLSKLRITNGCTRQISAVTFFAEQKSRHQKFAGDPGVSCLEETLIHWEFLFLVEYTHNANDIVFNTV